MKMRDYDPRTKPSLVGSITAGWRDEQKNRPRSRSASTSRGKTYSGAPTLESDQALEKEDSLMASSSADLKLSSKMNLQNINSAVKKISQQEEETKRPSFSKGMAKKVRKSMRNIFVNKDELLEFDFGDEPSESDQGHRGEDETENDTSERNSISLRDAGKMNDSSRSEGRGSIPILAGKIKDSKRGRSRSLKRKKEDWGKATKKGSRAGENPAETTNNNASRIRSRSESLIGRMRRRSNDKRKRRGLRGSGSPQKRRTSRLRPTNPQREASFHNSMADTPKATTTTMENSSRLESSISLLEEAQMASEIFREARRDNEEKERDRTLSTHESRTGSDSFFSDPAHDGSLRSRSERQSKGSSDGSSRHSRVVADILMEASTASLPVMSPLREHVLSDKSFSHGLGAVPSRLSIPLLEHKPMEASESSMPHLSPFSTVSNSLSQLPAPTGGNFSSLEQAIDFLLSDERDGNKLSSGEPKLGSSNYRRQKTNASRESSGGEPHFDAETQRVMRPLGDDSELNNADQDNKQSGSKQKRKNSKPRRKSDNTESSDSQVGSNAKVSSRNRPSKDPNDSSHRTTRRQRGGGGKMSSMSTSDRTHDVRRSRMTNKDEPSHRRRSLQVDSSSGGYGSLLEKQKPSRAKPKNPSSSRRRNNNANLDSSESQLKSRRHSKSAHGQSSSTTTTKIKGNDAGAVEKRNSVLRKGRRQQRSQSKTRSHSEGERKRSSSHMASRNMDPEQTGEFPQDLVGMFLTLNLDGTEDPVDFDTYDSNVLLENVDEVQMALNPSSLQNSSLPLDGGGLDRTKLTHSSPLEADDMDAPEPRSYHPRTEPMVEATSDAPISKSYHARSQSLLLKQSANKKGSESSNRKKKSKRSSTSNNVGSDGRDQPNGVDLGAVDPNQVEALLRSNGLEGRDLNEVDLTALDPAQVKAVLLRGNGSSRHRESSGGGGGGGGGGGETRTGRKTRRPSTRPRRAASEQIKSRSSIRMTPKEEKPASSKMMNYGNQSISTKDFENKLGLSPIRTSVCRRKIVSKEFGAEEEISAAFTESWRQFVGEVGFG